MTGQPAPGQPEELEQLRDQLRAEIREARETLKDLHREIKDARTLIPLLTDELFEAEVRKQVGELAKETARAMDAAVERVGVKFDELTDLYLRGSRRDRRTGAPSLPEMAAVSNALRAAREDHQS